MSAAPALSEKGPDLTPSPYQAQVDYGWCDLDIPGWPHGAGPRQLRGAILHALMPLLPGGEHSDWTGRLDDDGSTLERPPPVCYRAHGGRCQVYAVGPRSRDHLLALAYHLRAVQAPNGEALRVVSVEPHVATHDVVIAGNGAHVYRFRTPYYPGRAAYQRRPTPGDYTELSWPGAETPLHAARVAWAGNAILSSTATWLRDVCGLEARPTRPLSVQVLDYRERARLTWARPERGIADMRAGFGGVFAVNAALPPGIGIGARCSEGFGEVEPC